MAENRKRVTEMTVQDKTDMPARTARRNGGDASAGLLSWYAARPAERGLAYALTSNGYVIL